MGLFARWMHGLNCYFDDPGDPGAGGGGDGYPDIPEDRMGLVDDDPSATADPDAGDEPGADPDAPQPPPAAGRSGAADPGQDRGQQPPSRADERIRGLIEQNNRFQQEIPALRATLAHYQRQIAALTGQQPPQPQVPEEPPNPRDQAAIKAIYRLFPKLAPLLEKADDLVGALDVVQTMRNGQEQTWHDIGLRMWDALDKAVATAYGNQKLNPTAQQLVDAAFVQWLKIDPHAAARYNVGDVSIVKDFMHMYHTGLIRPLGGRSGQPQPGPGGPPRPGRPAPRQALGQPRVPRGGSGSGPVGARPPQPNVRKPEEVHDGAADAFFAQR